MKKKKKKRNKHAANETVRFKEFLHYKLGNVNLARPLRERGMNEKVIRR
jgi:hypothetical protein